MKHTAWACCSYCTFRHQSIHRLPVYACIRDVHCDHISSTRTLLWSLLLGFLGIDVSDTQYLGMADGPLQTEEDLDNCPVPQLAIKLNNVKHLNKRSISDDRLVRGFFNPLSVNVLVPNHLLTGTGKVILKVCFLQLKDIRMQKILDIGFWGLLKQLRKSYQSWILHAGYKKLNALSMTDISTSFLFLPLLLKALDYEQHVKASVCWRWSRISSVQRFGVPLEWCTRLLQRNTFITKYIGAITMIS